MDRCISLKGGASWSDFVGPYDALQKGQGHLNQERCPDVVHAVHQAKVVAATSLAAELMEQLAPVREVVGVLRNITRVGGMPQVRQLQPGMAGSRAGRCKSLPARLWCCKAALRSCWAASVAAGGGVGRSMR